MKMEEGQKDGGRIKDRQRMDGGKMRERQRKHKGWRKDE